MLDYVVIRVYELILCVWLSMFMIHALETCAKGVCLACLCCMSPPSQDDYCMYGMKLDVRKLCMFALGSRLRPIEVGCAQVRT